MSAVSSLNDSVSESATTSLARQERESMDDMDRWWYEILCRGFHICGMLSKTRFKKLFEEREKKHKAFVKEFIVRFSELHASDKERRDAAVQEADAALPMANARPLQWLPRVQRQLLYRDYMNNSTTILIGDGGTASNEFFKQFLERYMPPTKVEKLGNVQTWLPLAGEVFQPNIHASSVSAYDNVMHVTRQRGFEIPSLALSRALFTMRFKYITFPNSNDDSATVLSDREKKLLAEAVESTQRDKRKSCGTDSASQQAFKKKKSDSPVIIDTVRTWFKCRKTAPSDDSQTAQLFSVTNDETLPPDDPGDAGSAKVVVLWKDYDAWYRNMERTVPSDGIEQKPIRKQFSDLLAELVDEFPCKVGGAKRFTSWRWRDSLERSAQLAWHRRLVMQSDCGDDSSKVVCNDKSNSTDNIVSIARNSSNNGRQKRLSTSNRNVENKRDMRNLLEYRESFERESCMCCGREFGSKTIYWGHISCKSLSNNNNIYNGMLLCHYCNAIGTKTDNQLDRILEFAFAGYARRLRYVVYICRVLYIKAYEGQPQLLKDPLRMSLAQFAQLIQGNHLGTFGIQNERVYTLLNEMDYHFTKLHNLKRKIMALKKKMDARSQKLKDMTVEIESLGRAIAQVPTNTRGSKELYIADRELVRRSFDKKNGKQKMDKDKLYLKESEEISLSSYIETLYPTAVPDEALLKEKSGLK